MAESEPVEGQTTKKGKPRRVGHIRMPVMEDLKSDTVTPLVEKSVSSNVRIDSDDSTSYSKLAEVVEEHKPQVVAKEEINKVLPWVHLAVSNAKRMLLDVY